MTHNFPFVISTHLTTLLGERGDPEREIPGKAEEAQAMRYYRLNDRAARKVDLQG